MEKLGEMTWQQIMQAPKTGLGHEKMPRSSFKTTIPTTITEDIEDFLVFRFGGSSYRMVGFRKSKVFYIVFLDPDLTLYRH